jgi:hypothetical protein
LEIIPIIRRYVKKGLKELGTLVGIEGFVLPSGYGIWVGIDLKTPIKPTCEAGAGREGGVNNTSIMTF